MSEPGRKSTVAILKWPLLVLLLGITAGAMFVGGAYAYLQYQKRSDLNSRRIFQEAQTRLSNASKEAEDLRASFDTYQWLLGKGVFRPESRLDWIEALNRLKEKHRLLAMDYEMPPQRVAILPGNGSYPSIDLLGSRVKLKLGTLHEGDALAFLSDIARLPDGFHPFDRCSMKLLPVPQGPGVMPRVETECTLEWLTIRDKRAEAATAARASPASAAQGVQK